MPDTARRNKDQARIKRQERTCERNPKPELSDQQNNRGLAESDEQRRQRLSNHDLGRTKGCYEQLVEGSLFLFARDGHRGHQEHLGERERTDQAREDAPTSLEVGVIPGAGAHSYRRPAAAMRCPPV